ncbi:MAG: hypothetical protein GTO12_24140 [Proteobacteria bacterium]|nr:hypothetical protein [Pseudomonadota bacterium]
MRKKREFFSWYGPTSPSALLIFVFDPVDKMTYLSYKEKTSRAPTKLRVKGQGKNHLRLTNEGITLSSEMPRCGIMPQKGTATTLIFPFSCRT